MALKRGYKKLNSQYSSDTNSSVKFGTYFHAQFVERIEASLPRNKAWPRTHHYGAKCTLLE